MRVYKEIRFCKVCKARYVIEDKKFGSYYCQKCRDDYNSKKNIKKDS